MINFTEIFVSEAFSNFSTNLPLLQLTKLNFSIARTNIARIYFANVQY